MAFHFLDKDMMSSIITTMIRPKLEYTQVTWSPHKLKHVLKLLILSTNFSQSFTGSRRHG